MDDELAKKEIALWTSELIELLGRVDTLLFTRNEITVDAKKEELVDVIRFVVSHLEAAGCDLATQMKLEVAVEEIFVNIAYYAYKPGTGQATIRAEVTQDPRAITLTFKDSGRPFDPMAKEDPDITLPAEARRIGGLGILMVKKSMDEMSYEYKDNQNILTLKKYF